MNATILELEHDGNQWVPAIAPLGEDPDHCAQCWRHDTYKASQRVLHARQDACIHPPDERERIDITQFGDAIGYHLVRCGACGKPMEDL